MLTKELVLETIRKMPEDRFDDIDILLERLVILDKIQKGIDQADKGEMSSIEDVIKDMKEW